MSITTAYEADEAEADARQEYAEDVASDYLDRLADEAREREAWGD